MLMPSKNASSFQKDLLLILIPIVPNLPVTYFEDDRNEAHDTRTGKKIHIFISWKPNLPPQ
jgi:hypothetical protein